MQDRTMNVAEPNLEYILWYIYHHDVHHCTYFNGVISFNVTFKFVVQFKSLFSLVQLGS